MKGVLLSLISFSLSAGASFLSLRMYRGKSYFRVFLAVSPFAASCYCLLFYFLPDNLYFLPQSLLEPSRAIDFWNGFFILLLLFHIFWDASYAAILTGFAPGILVRLFRQKEEGLPLEELIKEFGGDEEIDQVLGWRLPNLLKGKYLIREGDRFRLMGKGRRIAKFSLFLKRLFKMEEGE